MNLQDFTSTVSQTIINIVTVLIFSFMGVLFYNFLKVSIKLNIRELFMDSATHKISHNKYWSNIAYLVATAVFLVLNLFYYKDVSDYIVELWVIYLGTLASSAILSKFISFKYGKNYRRNDTFEEYRRSDEIYEEEEEQKRPPKITSS